MSKDRERLEELGQEINAIFARARSGIELPQTPEEEYKWNLNQQTMWGGLMDLVMTVVEKAYYEIPALSVEGASSRTVLLEAAIREMTEKLIEYPSSPYTLNSTESLGNTISALKTSIEIDQIKGTS